MRTEISQAKKEVNYYLDNVEKNKTLTKIEERKSKKRRQEDGASQADQVNVVNLVYTKLRPFSPSTYYCEFRYWYKNH